MSTSAELEDHLSVLEESGIVKPVVGGKRKVSSASLSSAPSLSGSSSSAASHSASVNLITPPTSPDTFVSLPAKLECVETVEQVGYERATAQAIFDSWRCRDPESPYGLLHYITGHVLTLSRWTQNGQYEHALSRFGLRKEFRDVILDSEFSDIFGTRGLQYWTLDTLVGRYEALRKQQQKLREHADREHAKKAARRRALAGTWELPSNIAEPSATISLASSNFPASHVEVAAAGPLLMGHTVLWTGKSSWHRDLIRADGLVDLTAISSPEGGDFNNDRSALYCSYSRDVAQRYREYAARRVEEADSWLIRIQVPTSFVEGCTRHEIWHSDTWKKFVWHCRNTTPENAIPSELQSLCDTDLLEGHICSKDYDVVRAVPESQLSTALGPECLMRDRVNGGNATQWVLLGTKKINQLGILVRGKIHIDISGALMHAK